MRTRIKYKHYEKYLILLLFLSLLSSCENKIIQKIADDFETIEPHWSTHETTDNKSFKIVTDPLNESNKALLFNLYPTDFNAGGKRNEFVLKTLDSIGYQVEYSFKFLFYPEFFSKEKEQDWIMIHQWHDSPPLGFNWENYNMQTRPPIQVFIQTNPNGKFYIFYAYGLQDKNKNDLRYIKFEEPIESNKWYFFENKIYWNTNESGYSIPKINDEFLVNKDEDKEHKIWGANMFNNVPNYFKMGLYGNYKSNDTISVLMDEFSYKLRKGRP